MDEKAIRAAFFNELGDLLEKYEAELTAEDDCKPYGMQSPLILVEISGDGNYSHETVTWLDGKKARELAENPPK